MPSLFSHWKLSKNNRTSAFISADWRRGGGVPLESDAKLEKRTLYWRRRTQKSFAISWSVALGRSLCLFTPRLPEQSNGDGITCCVMMVQGTTAHPGSISESWSKVPLGYRTPSYQTHRGGSTPWNPRHPGQESTRSSCGPNSIPPILSPVSVLLSPFPSSQPRSGSLSPVPAYITTAGSWLLSLIPAFLTYTATLTPLDLPQLILKSSQAPLPLSP